jgi:hypothetical protein
MYFDPAQLTLGQVSGALRDFTVVGLLLTVSWKSRGVYEAAKNFFVRLTSHMDVMEEGMNTLLTNHLTHIEADLRNMSHRQVRATDLEQAQYLIDDETGK